MKLKFIWIYLLVLLFYFNVLGWGFEAHKYINRCAVFTLPPRMFTFYKYYLPYLTENAVNPDKRRYIVEGEAACHYIDLECYGENPLDKLSKNWNQAVEEYTQETLLSHGILPWNICRMKHMLTTAFRDKDIVRILKLSADIGHYIADANVPLHTSRNYNGQLTNQEGIHALWETRLPELFKEDYNLFIGKATYVKDPQKATWQAIMQAHVVVQSVLELEKGLSQNFNRLDKFSFEKKGSTLKKVYSEAYATAYHDLLAGQVERQMRASIKMVGDFWLTCWVDAGKPNLDDMLGSNLIERELEEASLAQTQLQVRECGD